MVQLREMFEIIDDTADTDVTTKEENGSDTVNSCKTIEVEGQKIHVVNWLWLPLNGDKCWILRNDWNVWVCTWGEYTSAEYRRKTWNIFLTESHAKLVIDYKLFLFDNMVRDGQAKWHEMDITSHYIDTMTSRFSWSDRISINSTGEVKDQFVSWQDKLAPIRLYNPFV